MFRPLPFLEQHGFRVPEEDLDSSAESSREGSVQILESHPRTFSVPSIDLDTESEDNEDEEEDDEIEIASSVQDEDENIESAATTPEQGDLGKDNGPQTIEADGAEDRSAAAGVRGLNLKGPRLEDVLSKPTALGTSQLNPIDLEGTSALRYDISDTESEDDGPEILPIPQNVSKDDEKADWSEPKLAQPQYRMPTVDDDAADRDAEALVARIIHETQARNTRQKGPATPDFSELPVDSVAGATDGFDTEDDDLFSQDDDFSDYFEREDATLKAQSSNTKSKDVSTSTSQLPPLGYAPAPSKGPRFQVPARTAAHHKMNSAQSFGSAISMSEPIDVSQPDRDDLAILSTPLPAIQRAPSPSDAALARKASDPMLKHLQTKHDHRRHAIVPDDFTFPPSERLYTAPVGVAPYKPFGQGVMGWADSQQDTHVRPYNQGPFSRRDDATVPQRRSSLAPDNLCAMEIEDDIQPFDACGLGNGACSVTPLNGNRSFYNPETRKENEGLSSKINISSLVNTYHAEHPRSCKRKAEDISSSNEFEEFLFATAPTQPATSQTQASAQPPPPSPYAAQSDDNDTNLPDAQPRDSRSQADAASLTQDNVVEPVISSISSMVINKTVETEGPARKKLRTSSSTSGGIGKFVSGVAVGLMGALAAFVATIPASVRDEALREMANGT